MFSMKLTCEEKAMLAGEMGPATATALARQMEVGTFFRAEDFVPVQTVHAMADRMGYTEIVEKAGGRILAGVCFYIMNARVLQERFHYRTLVTNSAKLANIISGYGYNPLFRPADTCIDAAVTGRVE